MCIGTRKTANGNSTTDPRPSIANFWSLPRFEQEASLQLNKESTGKNAQARQRKGKKRLQIPLGGTVNSRSGLGIPRNRE